MNSLQIPVELIQQAISRKELNRFKVFIALKLLSKAGTIILTKEEEIRLSKLCAFKSSKTLIKHIQSLVKIGFVGIDGNKRHT